MLPNINGQNIVGIGYDMVEVARIQSVLCRWGDRFEKRVFTPREIAYCGSKKNRFQRLASRFAAKEAVFKALGTGWQRGVGWTEIEVTNNDLGKPSIVLRGRTEELSRQLGVRNIFVSMTDTRDYAAAQVILTS
jgi:holo-[acyl-carrier protein] synthase